MSKREIRKQLKQKRAALNRELIEQYSNQACQLFLNSKYYTQANTIALYLPIHNELSPKLILEQSLQDQKQIYLPKLSGEILKFFEFTPQTELAKNQFGILEPVNSKTIQTEEIDLVLVPLVAFDINKNRLGQGAGYYDKTFAFLKTKQKNKSYPKLMGLGYEFQKISQLNVEPWDIPLDNIISEKKIY